MADFDDYSDAGAWGRPSGLGPAHSGTGLEGAMVQVTCSARAHVAGCGAVHGRRRRFRRRARCTGPSTRVAVLAVTLLVLLLAAHVLAAASKAKPKRRRRGKKKVGSKPKAAKSGGSSSSGTSGAASSPSGSSTSSGPSRATSKRRRAASSDVGRASSGSSTSGSSTATSPTSGAAARRARIAARKARQAQERAAADSVDATTPAPGTAPRASEAQVESPGGARGDSSIAPERSNQAPQSTETEGSRTAKGSRKQKGPGEGTGKGRGAKAPASAAPSTAASASGEPRRSATALSVEDTDTAQLPNTPTPQPVPQDTEPAAPVSPTQSYYDYTLVVTDEEDEEDEEEDSDAWRLGLMARHARGRGGGAARGGRHSVPAPTDAAPAVNVASVSATAAAGWAQSSFPPLLLVTTMDGSFHGLNAKTGEHIWTVTTDHPLISSFQRYVPRLAATEAPTFGDGGYATDDSDPNEHQQPQSILIPARDGSIIFYGTSGMQKLPHDARRLAEACPVVTDTMHFVGGKRSQLLGIDVRTGVIHRSYHSSSGVCHFGEDSGEARTEPLLWIGRQDHTVQAHDADTGAEAWNFTVGEVLPPRFSFAAATDFDEQGGVPSQDAERAGLLQELELAVTVDGGIFATDPETGVGRWSQALSSHVSAIHLVPQPGDRPLTVPFADVPPGAADPSSRPPGAETAVTHTGARPGSVLSGAGSDIYVARLPNGQLYAYPQSQWRHKRPNLQAPDVPYPTYSTDVSYAADHHVNLIDADGHTGTLGSLDDDFDDGVGPTGYAPAATDPGFCFAGNGAFPTCLLGGHNLSTMTSGSAAPALLPQLPPAAFGASDDRVSKLDVDRGAGIVSLSVHWSVAVLIAVAALMVTAAAAVYVFVFLFKRTAPDPAPGPAAVDDTAAAATPVAANAPDADTAGPDALAGTSNPTPAELPKVQLDGVPHTLVGTIAVSEKVLGYGSHGTVVYGGRLDERPVAVKRVLREYCHVASREVSLLIKLDDHDNVVRYFAREEHADFVYLALEKCSQSLASAVGRAQGRRDKVVRRLRDSGSGKRGKQGRQGKGRGRVRGRGRGPGRGSQAATDSGGSGTLVTQSRLRLTEVPVPSNATRRFLKELVVGVAHIHLHSIVHRDIKPHNFLLVPLAAKKAARVADAAERAAMLADASASAGAGAGASVAELDDEGEELVATDGKRGKMTVTERALAALDPAERALVTAEHHRLGIQWRPKVSDMGLAKQLRPSASSFGADSHLMHPSLRGLGGASHQSSSSGRAPGSVGWQAPEVMQALLLQSRGHAAAAPPEDGVEADGDGAVLVSRAEVAASAAKRKTRAVDVWSLGCVLYTVLDAGRHPYGEWFERESNILKGQYNLRRLDHIPEAQHVIAAMINVDPEERPTAAEVVEHPFFWDDKKRMDFLQELSDLLEREGDTSRVVCALEASARQVVGAGWDKKLPVELVADMAKYRRYKTNSLVDLLRLIRNKRHHYGDLPEALQNEIGFSPTSFIRYFTSRFPQLLLVCYRVACATLAHVPAVARLIGPETARRHAPASTAAAAEEEAAKARAVAIMQAVDTARAAGATSAVVDSSAVDGTSAPAPAPPPVRGTARTAGPAARAGAKPGLARAWYVGLGAWLTAGSGPGLAAAALDGDPEETRQSKQRTNYAGGNHREDPRYKTRLCKDFETNCYCARGWRCDFAHGPWELRVRRPMSSATRRKARRGRSSAPSPSNARGQPATPSRGTGASTSGDDAVGSGRGRRDSSRSPPHAPSGGSGSSSSPWTLIGADGEEARQVHAAQDAWRRGPPRPTAGTANTPPHPTTTASHGAPAWRGSGGSAATTPWRGARARARSGSGSRDEAAPGDGSPLRHAPAATPSTRDPFRMLGVDSGAARGHDAPPGFRNTGAATSVGAPASASGRRHRDGADADERVWRRA